MAHKAVGGLVPTVDQACSTPHEYQQACSGFVPFDEVPILLFLAATAEVMLYQGREQNLAHDEPLRY